MRDPEEPTLTAPGLPSTASEEKEDSVRIVLDDTTPPAPLRGLLAPPPDVVAIVNRENARLPASPEYRQEMLDYLSMSYYFGGHWAAYRKTSRGAEVLAVGWEEMGELNRSLSAAEREGIISGYCDRWPLPKSTAQR